MGMLPKKLEHGMITPVLPHKTEVLMKYILVIGDGMADDPVLSLGMRTPLQYAKTPGMDMLASAGVLGSALTIPEGMPAGSDVAILSIFGCDPEKCFFGRAPLEAAAMGVRLSPGDVAYRCNMVTFEDGDMAFDEKKIVSHSAGSIDGAVSDAIITWLFETLPFKQAAEEAGVTIYPSSSFRHVVVQKAQSIKGIRLIPPHDHLGEPLGMYMPSGCDNAAVLGKLMRLAHGILEDHPYNAQRRKEGKLPANGIWFWAEGTAAELPGFTERYGKTGGIVSAVPLCQGIGVLIGLDVALVEGATGELDTNYEGKVDAVLGILESRDFAAVHIEAPDECTHDGDTKGKLQAIEWIDSRVVAPIADRLRRGGMDFRMLVLSDHKTLTASKSHGGGPVPYVLYDSRVDRKSGLSFCEDDAALGGCVRAGTDLMEMLFEES